MRALYDVSKSFARKAGATAFTRLIACLKRHEIVAMLPRPINGFRRGSPAPIMFAEPKKTPF